MNEDYGNCIQRNTIPKSIKVEEVKHVSISDRTISEGCEAWEDESPPCWQKSIPSGQ